MEKFVSENTQVSQLNDELQQQVYEKSYQGFTPEWLANKSEVSRYLATNSEALIKFYEDYASQFNFPSNGYDGLKILDLGCGLGGLSIYFANKGASVTGVDISSLAIGCAHEIAQDRGLDIHYQHMDITNYDGVIGKFDLVMDSHLLHCITDIQKRQRYWQFVKKHLKTNGLFLLETMCYQDELEIPVGYRFDEDCILWQESENDAEYPIRKLLPSIEIEAEIKASGLEINYLYYHAELAFDVFTEYQNYPHKHLPKTLRVAGKVAAQGQ
jgi:2-polyprenyl-3-methyl-5-hydroxy-6-metoxy-1,4-benzoquinol methylase